MSDVNNQDLEKQLNAADNGTKLDSYQIAVIVVSVFILITLAVAIASFFFPMATPQVISGQPTFSGTTSGSTNFITQTASIATLIFTNNNSGQTYTVPCEFLLSGNIVTMTFQPSNPINCTANGFFITSGSAGIPAALRPQRQINFVIVMQSESLNNCLAQVNIQPNGQVLFGSFQSYVGVTPNNVPILVPVEEEQ